MYMSAAVRILFVWC